MSNVKKYRKLPVEIEAIQWDGFGSTLKTQIEIFVGKELSYQLENETAYVAGVSPPLFSLLIETKEGIMKAMPGDWILKEAFPTGDRDFYPCKPDIFAKTYEQLEETSMEELSEMLMPFKNHDPDEQQKQTQTNPDDTKMHFLDMDKNTKLMGEYEMISESYWMLIEMKKKMDKLAVPVDEAFPVSLTLEEKKERDHFKKAWEERFQIFQKPMVFGTADEESETDHEGKQIIYWGGKEDPKEIFLQNLEYIHQRMPAFFMDIWRETDIVCREKFRNHIIENGSVMEIIKQYVHFDFKYFKKKWLEKEDEIQEKIKQKK